MTMRRALGWMVVGGALLAFAPVVATGCKDEKKSDDSKSDKSEKSEKKDKDKGGDDEEKDKGKGKKDKDGDDGDKGDKADKGKKDKGDAKKYVTGDVLKHMPKDCAFARMYLNVGLLLKNEAVEKSAEALEDKLASSTKGKKKGEAFGKVMASLKKSGIDPARDIKEIALCAENEKGDPVVALGGDFAGKDIVAAMKKAVEEAGDKEVDVKEMSGVKVLKDGNKYAANIAPNILLFTKDKEQIADLQKESDPDAKWDHDKSRILSFDMKPKGEQVAGTITEKGDDLDFKVTMDMKGSAGAEMKDNPEKVKKQFQQIAEKIEAKLAKGPFKKISDDLGKTKFDVDGTKLTISVTIPAADLGDSIKAAASASDEDLKNAVDL